MVERNLPKVEVAGSNSVPRSIFLRGWCANRAAGYSSGMQVNVLSINYKHAGEKLNWLSTW